MDPGSISKGYAWNYQSYIPPLYIEWAVQYTDNPCHNVKHVLKVQVFKDPQYSYTALVLHLCHLLDPEREERKWRRGRQNMWNMEMPIFGHQNGSWKFLFTRSSEKPYNREGISWLCSLTSLIEKNVFVVVAYCSCFMNSCTKLFRSFHLKKE